MARDTWATGKPRRIRAIVRVGVVAPAVGAVPDDRTIAPALSRGEVPDVLVLAAQAEDGLGSKLFSHSRPSLGATQCQLST